MLDIIGASSGSLTEQGRQKNKVLMLIWRRMIKQKGLPVEKY